MPIIANSTKPDKPGQLVVVSLELQNGRQLHSCLSLRLEQDLFGHHRFEVTVPYEDLESEDNVFVNQAHQNVCGQLLKISFSPLMKDGSFDFQFKGVVTGITLKQKDLSSVYVLRGFSPTIVLEDTIRRYSYLNMGLSDIFNNVLGQYPSNILKHSLNPRNNGPIPYSVQYDESNFDFLSRLAADNGEWFYYDGSELHLGEPQDGESKDFKSDGTQSFTMSIDLAPTGFTVDAYDYTQDQHYVYASGHETVDGLNSFGSFAMDESQSLFSNTSGYLPLRPAASNSDVQDEVKNRKSVIGSGRVTFQGNGVEPVLSIGTWVKVSGSIPQNGGRSDEDSFGDYRVIRIVHEVDEKGNYSNVFEAIPKSVKYPPANLGVKRPVGKPEVAEVSDTNDPDNLGRVKVDFMWPNSGNNHDSAWIRPGTFYSGGDDGKGALFIPEVGAQVVVGYEDDNPDMPIILTSVYPKKSGTRAAASSNSEKIIYTKAGNIIDISDENNNNSITISNSNMTGTSLTLSFKDNGSIALKTDGKIDITASQDVTISGQNISLKAQQKIQLQGMEIDIQADQTIDAKANQSVSIASQAQLQMKGAMSELDGNATLTLKGGIVQIN